MPNFKIHVSKDYLVFCAAHFVTYDGVCEPLHGHNYRASVTVEGDLQDDHFVLNFVTLKRTLRKLVDQLDHLTLLPATNPHFRLTHADHEITVDVGNRRYVLPETDVLILPMSNTTAELLAQYLAGQLRVELRDVPNLTACEMTVDEVQGQSATYREAWR
ncbi:MAG: 6-carboxytetrahydropterin synthase [Chloroflexi bacterium]|nr:6-carboxytetrahydropterin synthase [Chloroflexota bacterium]